MEFESRTLAKVFSQLDYELYDMEMIIVEQKKEIERLQKNNSEYLCASLAQSQKMMAQNLLACIDVPSDISSIGTVGATILSRINDMHTIEEVKEYIKTISALIH